MIIRRGDGFYVLSANRDKVLGGPYRTRAEATRVFDEKVLGRVAAKKVLAPDDEPERPYEYDWSRLH